jgi:hypothetical protein
MTAAVNDVGPPQDSNAQSSGSLHDHLKGLLVSVRERLGVTPIEQILTEEHYGDDIDSLPQRFLTKDGVEKNAMSVRLAFEVAIRDILLELLVRFSFITGCARMGRRTDLNRSQSQATKMNSSPPSRTSWTSLFSSTNIVSQHSFLLLAVGHQSNTSSGYSSQRHSPLLRNGRRVFRLAADQRPQELFPLPRSSC